MSQMSEKRWVAFLSNSGVDDATKVSTAGCTDVDDFINVIKSELQLPHPAREITLHLSEDELPMNRRDKVPPQVSGDAWVVKVRTNAKRPLLEGDWSVVKKAKSLPLVQKNVGWDFVYLDRIDTFKTIKDCILKRHGCWKEEVVSKENHPILFAAGGPGSGKSRLLQEMPNLFVEYASQFLPLKEILSKAIFINVTFNSWTCYTSDEVRLGIQQSLCLRILWPAYKKDYPTFVHFYDAFKNESLLLGVVLDKLSKGASCIVFGIDEVNQVYDTSKEQFKELFRVVGGLSCSPNSFPLFVPILAGTVIGPMEDAIKGSSQISEKIPLPLLSFDSSCAIFAKKDIKYVEMVKDKDLEDNRKLRILIADVGGHCRALDLLFEALEFYSNDSSTYWDQVLNHVCGALRVRYEVGRIPLGAAIAYSFLSLKVNPDAIYRDDTNLTFLRLEEKGLIKLDKDKDKLTNKDKLTMPYLFVYSYLSKDTMACSKFWTNLLIDHTFWWQDWEVFNRDYIAFRLSLFAYLGYTQVTLREFFKGAQMNLPDDFKIKVPAISEIKASRVTYQFPTTKCEWYSSGDSVLNGAGAPFDSFMYLDIVESTDLENTSNIVKTLSDPGIPDRVLFVFQMKSANQNSENPQEITDGLIDKEVTKAETSLDSLEETQGTKVVFVILGRCEGTFTKELLPLNCVVVSKNELCGFYGEPYYRRLLNL